MPLGRRALHLLPPCALRWCCLHLLPPCALRWCSLHLWLPGCQKEEEAPVTLAAALHLMLVRACSSAQRRYGRAKP